MQNDKINGKKSNALITKNKIYTTAKELFRKHGFEDVSVDYIVQEAGVSKGTFYVHFESKDSLAAALIIDFVGQVDYDYKLFIESFQLKTAASHILLSLIGKIADVITDTIGYQYMKTLYKVQLTKTIATNAVLGYNRDLYKTFSELINKGIQEGEFTTEIPVDTLTKHFIMALRGLTYEWCIRHPDFDLKEQALTHFGLLLTGLKINK